MKYKWLFITIAIFMLILTLKSASAASWTDDFNRANNPVVGNN